MEDTIAAITTALGPAGVGIIRISGADAGIVADRVFRGKKGIKLGAKESHTVTYGYIEDTDGTVIDEALALTMWGPHSYTGEDVVELQCHGGMIVERTVLELVLKAGARLAEPGEYSKRAFLNGRLDLSQAEAIMDIIGAKTEISLRAAAGALQGGITKESNAIRDRVTEIMAYLEADIDFPEEELERLTSDELQEKINVVEKAIAALTETYRSGHILREGLKTAIIGKPNAGKSSLLNAILQEKRAIVTEIPGTTRDAIEEYYNMGGIPLLLIDTAGIRKTQDIVERLGVERTKEIVEEADIILYILDISVGATREDFSYLRGFPAEKLLVVVNKVDLAGVEIKEQDILEKLQGYEVIFISAKERIGLKKLEEAIYSKVFLHRLEPKQTQILTNTRQKDALVKAGQAVRSANDSLLRKMPSDFIAIDLRQAWLYLGEITGETLDEEIIDQIFSRFCLGK